MPFEIDSDPLTIGPILQVATHPIGTDAVELVWEINDYLPRDASTYHTHLSVFEDDTRLLEGKTVNVLAGFDGENFTRIGSVKGPANRFVHEGVVPGRLYYYKLTATTGKGEEPWGESPAVMGAAGANLVAHPGFEAFRAGTLGTKVDVPEGMDVGEGGAFRVKKGGRPFGQGSKILAFDPADADTKQISYLDRTIEFEEEAAYLQGGWIRAPGNVWYGRTFLNEERNINDSWGYSIPALRKTPEWVFAVQRLEEADDWDAYDHHADGRPHGMARMQWTYPVFAAQMRPFMTAFGPGELDDLWIIRVTNAPPGAAISP